MDVQTERQKMSAQRNKRRAAQHYLRDQYRSEFEELLATERRVTPAPRDYANAVERALTKLGRAHQEEYERLMGPKKRPETRWVVGPDGTLVER